MTSEQGRSRDESSGSPAWVLTFADLMSLMLCFFVLLLSFAELDPMKYKMIAGSMQDAFGVQREIKTLEIPKGTSIIAQEFSPGKPQPTVLDEVRQHTVDEDQQSLEFTDAVASDADEASTSQDGADAAGAARQAGRDAAALVAVLQQEIAKGLIQVETEGSTITVRIQEKGSFPSGTARFDPSFRPVIAKLQMALKPIRGRIAVAGHTDNVPIKTVLYRSNWDLASARAVSVIHALLEDQGLDPARFVAESHAEAHPLVANDSAANRSLNRRVEIIIRKDTDKSGIPEETVAAYATKREPEQAPGGSEAKARQTGSASSASRTP